MATSTSSGTSTHTARGTSPLDLCDNAYGPLSDEVKMRLRRYLVAPSAEGWHDIHGIILSWNPIRTVWQALIHVDASTPRSGPRHGMHETPKWTWWPDAVTLMRAIRWAVDNRKG